MDEVWRGAIYQGIDYSWRFHVSDRGRLRNAKTGKIYSYGYGAGGYRQICVSVCGKRMNVRIHRCVAETFIPNPCGYEIVNHIDGCKQNNSAVNLEWCTRKENYRHAVEHDLIDPDIPAQIGYNSRMGSYVGSCNGRSKLSEPNILYIRDHYIQKARGVKCNRAELAERFGVSPCLISKIVNGDIWTHI